MPFKRWPGTSSFVNSSGWRPFRSFFRSSFWSSFYRIAAVTISMAISLIFMKIVKNKYNCIKLFIFYFFPKSLPLQAQNPGLCLHCQDLLRLCLLVYNRLYHLLVHHMHNHQQTFWPKSKEKSMSILWKNQAENEFSLSLRVKDIYKALTMRQCKTIASCFKNSNNFELI